MFVSVNIFVFNDSVCVAWEGMFDVCVPVPLYMACAQSCHENGSLQLGRRKLEMWGRPGRQQQPAGAWEGVDL